MNDPMRIGQTWQRAWNGRLITLVVNWIARDHVQVLTDDGMLRWVPQSTLLRLYRQANP